ncbi:MAG TPA: serine/threonine-protein kinase, partial [Verrucomicrobiaceae bacterium]
MRAAFPQLEVVGLIGSGGMGAVFKARQPQLDRYVALKILPTELACQAGFSERFQREAQALAKLSHPHIVAVHDFGQAGGFYYLLMEFVDGVNLRQLLQTKKLTPKEALSIVPPVCEALQCAHDHGIVHRDIKPENLLIDKEGAVKIADFGVAKIIAASTEKKADAGPAVFSSAVTLALGTPDYAAPEQKEANGEVDHRADIYSLGVVLYEMLTGERPKERIEPPSRRVQLDIRIDEIVLRALEKEPELRFATAAEFRTRVEAVADSPEAEGRRDPRIRANRATRSMPWPLKVVITWFLLTGVWAAAEWAIDHRLGYDFSLTVLNLFAGFGLMSRKKCWWWFAAIFNGIQLGFIVLALFVLTLAPEGATLLGIVIGPLVSPHPSRAFAAGFGILAAMLQGLVQWTLIRLRSQGCFDHAKHLASPPSHGSPAAKTALPQTNTPLSNVARCVAYSSGIFAAATWLSMPNPPELLQWGILVTALGGAALAIPVRHTSGGKQAMWFGGIQTLACLFFFTVFAILDPEDDSSSAPSKAKHFGSEAALGPIIEKMVSLTGPRYHGLDFESGNLIEPAKLSLLSVENQLRAKGADIFYDPRLGRWRSLDLMAIPETAKLDQFKVSDLTRMRWDPSLAAGDFNAEPNRSNIFKTREGSLGVVEITKVADAPPMALIRYKLVTNAVPDAVQEETVDLQPDGSARLKITLSTPNLTSRTIDRSEFIAANGFHLEKITDSHGWPVRIEGQPGRVPASHHY